MTSGSSAFVFHNGERLISFPSAADRDSASTSLNNALWQPSVIDSLSSSSSSEQIPQLEPALIPGLLQYSLILAFLCFSHVCFFRSFLPIASLGSQMDSKGSINKLSANTVLIIFVDFADKRANVCAFCVSLQGSNRLFVFILSC